MPAEQSKSVAVTVLGLITMLWGATHVALGVSCNLSGDHWTLAVGGFAPVHWIVGDAYDSNVGIVFVLQGILGMLAGSGVLLRLQWGRILTFIVAIVAILWFLDAVDAYNTQGDDFQWKTVLIPFAAVQVLYSIVAILILIKNGAAFSEPEDTDQSKGRRRLYVLAAWASPVAGAVIAIVLSLWSEYHLGKRGDRESAVLIFYLILLFASAVGGLAAAISLFGIRSWRNALSVIPGALLGICINGANVFICFLSYFAFIKCFQYAFSIIRMH